MKEISKGWWTALLIFAWAAIALPFALPLVLAIR